MLSLNSEQFLLIKKQFELHFLQTPLPHKWKTHPFLNRDINSLVADIVPSSSIKIKQIAEIYCFYHILSLSSSLEKNFLKTFYQSIKEDLESFTNKTELNILKLFFNQEIFNISINAAYHDNKKPIHYLLNFFSYIAFIVNDDSKCGISSSLSILNKIKSQDFSHHQFKDKFLASLNKVVSSSRLTEDLNLKLNQEKKTRQDFQVIQSNHSSFMLTQEDNNEIFIQNNNSASPIKVQDFIKTSLGDLKKRLGKNIKITNDSNISTQQERCVDLIMKEEEKEHDEIYLPERFKYCKTRQKEKRNIGIKIVCKSTDKKGIYEIDESQSLDNQSIFFFSEDQFVSLYDEKISVSNIKNEELLDYEDNPFFEERRKDLLKEKQKHFLVIRIHLVPDDETLSHLIEDFTSQCTYLNVKKTEYWKVKIAYLDRIAVYTAPETTIQALSCGQDQVIIQNMLDYARQVFEVEHLSELKPEVIRSDSIESVSSVKKTEYPYRNNKNNFYHLPTKDSLSLITQKIKCFFKI